MDEQPTEKKCTKCGETKPLEEFNKHSMGRFGRRSQCRACLHRKYMDNREEVLAKQAAYRKEHREEKIARDRAYYWANKQELNAKQAEYRKKNRDLIRERDRKWREKNAEKKRAADRAYYAKNAEAVKARVRDYETANPHRGWLNGYRFRARQYGLTPIVEDFTKADVIAKYGDHCAYCETGAFENLDHYVPIKKGGPHTLENVRPSCAACNNAKYDADPEEWLAEQAEFDALTEDEQNALIDAEIAKYLDDED